jgi:hypothetical protein
MHFTFLVGIAAAIAGARHAVPLRAQAAAQAAQSSQGEPLRRTFHAGEESRYRVRLVVRSELEGPETVKIGEVTYVKTVQHSAEARLSWTISERVTRLAADGAAEIREQLESFEAPRLTREADAEDAQSARLSVSLLQMLSGWANSRALEFRVAPNGAATGLGTDAAPQADEPPPPLLTLWLAHALRPAATLPDRPVQPGVTWQEPRKVQVKGWTDVRAGETDEWLDTAAEDRAALRLHVVQEISGRILESAAKVSGGVGVRDDDEAKNPPGNKTERFFAESLSTISLDDGRVLAASRSARKEIVQVLPPAPGMTEPPRFRATLSVQVEIESCVGGPCEAVGNH